MPYDRSSFSYTAIHPDKHCLGNHFGILLEVPYASAEATLIIFSTDDRYKIAYSKYMEISAPFLSDSDNRNIVEYITNHKSIFNMLFADPYKDLSDVEL